MRDRKTQTIWQAIDEITKDYVSDQAARYELNNKLLELVKDETK